MQIAKWVTENRMKLNISKTKCFFLKTCSKKVRLCFFEGSRYGQVVRWVSGWTKAQTQKDHASDCLLFVGEFGGEGR